MDIDQNGSAVTDISDEQPRVGRAGNVRESEASISSCYVTLIEHQLREYMGSECARLEAAYARIGQPRVLAVEHCGTNRPRRDDAALAEDRSRVLRAHMTKGFFSFLASFVMITHFTVQWI